MPTVAKSNFSSHISQCDDAIKIHEYLEPKGYSADFGLRFVWVASISALDHYMSELIVETATQQFSDGSTLTGKLLNETVPVSAMLQMHSLPSAAAVLEFRNTLSKVVRFRSFQKADDIGDGLSYFWNEAHKWNKIASELGLKPKQARAKLNSIAYRRDLIAHNADYDGASGMLMPCHRSDAIEVVDYVKSLVHAIEKLAV